MPEQTARIQMAIGVPPEVAVKPSTTTDRMFRHAPRRLGAGEGPTRCLQGEEQEEQRRRNRQKPTKGDRETDQRWLVGLGQWTASNNLPHMMILRGLLLRGSGRYRYAAVVRPAPESNTTPSYETRDTCWWPPPRHQLVRGPGGWFPQHETDITSLEALKE